MTCRKALPAAAARGFTLLELLVTLAIVGLLLAVSVPGTQSFYQSMQYRHALREVLGTLSDARRKALDSGRAQDVAFDTSRGTVEFDGETEQLPEGFELGVTSASEVNRQGVGVIRFYPEGGSTGGDIDISAPSGRGVRISVDWLMGSVKQVAHDDG